MTFDLGWPCNVHNLGHWIFTSNVSRTVRYMMMDTHDVIYRKPTMWFCLVVCNRSQIRNHLYIDYWHYDHWLWLTLNRPRSGSQAFHFKYLEYDKLAHKVDIFLSIANMNTRPLQVRSSGQIRVPQNVFLANSKNQLFNSSLNEENVHDVGCLRVMTSSSI